MQPLSSALHKFESLASRQIEETDIHDDVDDHNLTEKDKFGSRSLTAANFSVLHAAAVSSSYSVETNFIRSDNVTVQVMSDDGERMSRLKYLSDRTR